MNYPSDYVKIRESSFYNENVNKDIRILSVGDIHLSKRVDLKDVDKLLKVIESNNPNYICLLGDIIDTTEELTYKKRLLELDVLIKNCGNIAPTFIILGNHDYYYDNKNDLLIISHIWEDYERYSNIYLLNDRSYCDDNIFVGGYLQKGKVYNSIEKDLLFHEDLSKIDSLIKNLPSDRFKLFITHSPEPIKSDINQRLLKDYNLIIAGHYHGGVVPSFLDKIIPKNNGLLTPTRDLFPKDVRGIVKLSSGTYLIYNGGWTKIPATAKEIMYPFDNMFNRDIDITNVTNNYEYYDMLVKTKRLKI